MLVFDTGLPGRAVEVKTVTVWEARWRAYTVLGTPAGEKLPYAVFENLPKKRRSDNPTAHPELHSKGARGRRCAAALNIVVRDMGDWASAGSYDRIQHFDFVYELVRNLAACYDCLFCFGQWSIERQSTGYTTTWQPWVPTTRP